MHMVGPETIEQFVSYLAHQRGASPHTVRAYRGDVAELIAYLGSKLGREVTVDDLRHKVLQEWLESLHRDRRLSHPLIERKRSALRSFCKCLCRSELMTQNPSFDLLIPKAPKRLPKFFQEEDADSLVQAPLGARKEGHIVSVRDHAAMKLLSECGLRRAEVTSIKIDEIQWDAPQAGRVELRVIGKGDKERVVALAKGTEALRAYYDRRGELKPQPGERALFLDAFSGEALSPDAITAFVGRYGKRRGLKANPHKFRHTCATQLLLHGAEPAAIQALLGHTDLRTTTLYMHVTAAYILEQAVMFHPANRDLRPPPPKSVSEEITALGSDIAALRAQLETFAAAPAPAPLAAAPLFKEVGALLRRAGAWVWDKLGFG